MRTVKRSRHGCERCEDRDVPARFRALVDRWLCDPCWRQTQIDLGAWDQAIVYGVGLVKGDS